MELTRSLVEAKAREYRETEMLADTEQEHFEILPGMFADGDFGRRDAEWVVQWYFRRYLGAYPDADRRAVESAFEGNDFGNVLEAVAAARAADSDAERVRRLTALGGVDVRVASAFLQFISPEAYVVVGDREWAVLRAAGELAAPYPDPPELDDYLTYLATCRSVADRLDCDLPTLYRALWRLWEGVDGAEDRTG
jgi:hypothetical protein